MRETRFMPNILPFRHLQRVYCAGPLFNAAERSEMEQIASVLAEAGFEPFVPHADGMEYALVHPYLIAQGYDAAAAGQLLHEAIFALDTYQVMAGCGSLVFNLNGRVPDEGAVAEAAMAWTLGKPIVIYKDDARSPITGRDNPLLVGPTRFETIDRVEDLPAALWARVKELAPDPACEVPCPPHIARVLEAGEQLYCRLQALGDSRPDDAVADIVLSLFGTQEQTATS